MKPLSPDSLSSSLPRTLLPAFLALVLALGAAPAPAQENEESSETETVLEPAEPVDPAEEPARHALVLLMDNQRRVLDAGPGVASLRMMAGADAGAQPVDPTAAAAEAHASLEITSELVEDASGLDVGVYLQRMQQSQERSLELLQGRAGSEGNPMSSEVNGLLMVFAEAARGASALLPLGNGERHRILLEYRDRIARGPVSALESAGGIDDSDFDDGGDPMPSAEEVERKKEKYAQWLAENERREKEMKRRRAERTERIRNRSAKSPGPAPKVGITREAQEKRLREKPDPKMLPKMEVWHIRWSKKADVLKGALGQFQKLDLKRHTTKSMGVCGHLYKAVVSISSDETVMKAPDPQVREDLGIAVAAMQEMAHTCTHGKFDETKAHRAESRKALRRAVERMKVYGLAF